jgi:hypothetical protein
MASVVLASLNFSRLKNGIFGLPTIFILDSNPDGLAKLAYQIWNPVCFHCLYASGPVGTIFIELSK